MSRNIIGFVKSDISVRLQVIMDAIFQCPWPLYVATVMKEAVRWRSSLDVSQQIVSLPDSVENAVYGLLDDVERHLGVVFVSHTLAFITVVDAGLSEVG